MSGTPSKKKPPGIYDVLPGASTRKIGKKKKNKKDKEATTASGAPILESLVPVRPKWKPRGDSLAIQVEHKALVLDRGKATPSKVANPKPTKSSGKLRIPVSEQKYALYVPLAKLWAEYASSIIENIPINISSAAAASKLGERILRMDLHGAHVEVVRSKDPGLVGKQGILIAETANTILLALKEDRVITVPKSVAVIRFDVGDKSVEVMLPALTYRSSERSARKMKKIKGELLI